MNSRDRDVTPTSRMPYFGTTRRFAPGGRLGHDRMRTLSVPVLESSVMSGPEKIRSRDPWSHIVS